MPARVQRQQAEHAHGEQRHRESVRGCGMDSHEQPDREYHGDQLRDRHHGGHVRGSDHAAGQRECNEVGEHAVEDVLADVPAEVHAEVQPEGANAQCGGEILEQLCQVAEGRTLRRLVVSGDVFARPLPGEQIDGERHEHEEHREHDAQVQEGAGGFLAAEPQDDEPRQPQRGDVGDLSADDACTREFRLGPVIRRHLGGERLVRDDLHRVHQLEEAVGDEVVPETLALDPHEGEAWHQGHGQQDEKTTAAKLPAQPAVMEMVGDVADDGGEERVEQARGHEDDAGLGRREAAERCVEEQDPDADDRHRAGAEKIVGAIGDVVTEPDLACGHQVKTRLSSPSARMARAWPYGMEVRGILR